MSTLLPSNLFKVIQYRMEVVLSTGNSTRSSWETSIARVYVEDTRLPKKTGL